MTLTNSLRQSSTSCVCGVLFTSLGGDDDGGGDAVSDVDALFVLDCCCLFFLRLFKGLLLLLIFSFLVIYVLAVVDMFCFLCCFGHTPFCLTFSFFLCYCCLCCYCGCQSSLFLVPFVHVRLLSRQKFCTYIRVGRSRSPLLASRHRQSPHITQYPLSQQHQHTHSLTHSLPNH